MKNYGAKCKKNDMKVPMENLHLPENVINLSKNDKKAIKNIQVEKYHMDPT